MIWGCATAIARTRFTVISHTYDARVFGLLSIRLASNDKRVRSIIACSRRVHDDGIDIRGGVVVAYCLPKYRAQVCFVAYTASEVNVVVYLRVFPVLFTCQI